MNLMDARNLTVVLCPNLVKSPSPVRDVMMCSVPNAPTLTPISQAQSPSSPLQLPQTPAQPPHSPITPSLSQTSAVHTLSSPRPPQSTTLGAIIKLCIERYYEVFDEVLDRSEALPPSRLYHDEENATPASSSGSSSPKIGGPPGHRVSVLSNGSGRRDSRALFEDEDIDDAMLVMPIGPDSPGAEATGSNGEAKNGNGATTTQQLPYRARQRPSPLQNSNATQSPRSTYGNPYSPSSPATRSLHNVKSGPPSSYSPSYAQGGFGTVSRAKSTISIEKGEKHGGTWRKGSISIGRAGSTIGKSVGAGKAGGAGVEAHGITASGFFSPPPVPPLPRLDSERVERE